MDWQINCLSSGLIGVVSIYMWLLCRILSPQTEDTSQKSRGMVFGALVASIGIFGPDLNDLQQNGGTSFWHSTDGIVMPSSWSTVGLMVWSGSLLVQIHWEIVPFAGRRLDLTSPKREIQTHCLSAIKVEVCPFHSNWLWVGFCTLLPSEQSSLFRDCWVGILRPPRTRGGCTVGVYYELMGRI